MTVKDQRRLEILNRVNAHTITTLQACALLDVGPRQLRRIRKEYATCGAASIVHKNRGRAPSNKTSKNVADKLLALCGPEGKYHDFNISHATDMLFSEEGIQVSRCTLSRLLHNSGIRSRQKPRAPKHRCRRERRSTEGAMIQVDGSTFDWLEGRGHKMCLIGAIDDATSRIVSLRFRPTEDQIGYMWILRDTSQNYGLPESIYHDGHTILCSPKPASIENDLAGEKPMSAFQEMMDGLGIEQIRAHSPQAKGRIEKAWNTLQERLPKEMRLAGINTIEQANEFLPSYIESHQKRFAVVAREEKTAWVPLEADMDLTYYFSVRERRTVARDHTISWKGECYLILRQKCEISLANKVVTVHKDADGQIAIYHEKQRLRIERFSKPVKVSSINKQLPRTLPGTVSRQSEYSTDAFMR